MNMALFDLDNTLLGGDSDYLWGEFLVGIGAVAGDAHQRDNARYLAQYQAGELDVREFGDEPEDKGEDERGPISLVYNRPYLVPIGQNRKTADQHKNDDKDD